MTKMLSKNGLARCEKCGEELIAPYDGQPYWCIECSQEIDRKDYDRDPEN